MTQTKPRDLTLDALKGIGILLMVIGHSGVPWVNFIYLFHMPLFFMASGYTWRDRKAENADSARGFLLSRLRGLWMPYVLCNGSFTLLHNTFIRLGLYAESAGLRTLGQTVSALVKNLLFAGCTTFGGATWFLRTLFFVSVAHLALRWIACHWKHGKMLFALAVALTVAGAELVNRMQIRLPLELHNCFAAYAAFLLGVGVRKVRLTDRIGKYKIAAILGSFALLLLLYDGPQIAVASGSIRNTVVYALASLAGWIMVWGVASALTGRTAQAAACCGRNSMWIVLLHFVAFKAVILGYLLITGGDMTQLSRFPVLWVRNLWPVYTAVGTVLPLMAAAAAKQIGKTTRRENP